MHPNGIIAVFLALLTVIVSFTEDSRTRWASIGLVLAVVLCIKVNAGLLLVLAIVFSISTRLPYLRKRRRLGIVMSAACAVPALLLVRSNVWLLLLTLLSICFLGVALHRLAPMSAVQGQRCLQWFGGALIGGLVIATACAWLVGSPPDVLWRALAIRPLGLEDAFSIPFAIPGTAVLAALTSVFILAATARGQQGHTAGVRIAIGGLGSGLLIALGPALVLPLSWVSLLKERVSGIRGWELPALATWFLLTVFPVAGSQVALASILFVPVLLQMLAGGLRDIVVPQQFATRPLFARILAVALILASATLMIWSSTEPIRKAGSAYESREPLVAGDASGVRLTPDEAKILRDNAQWVRENCDTFYSFPGLNTYYVLTSLPVPGSATATTWWALLDDAEQQKVIADMEQAQSPCFLRFNALTNFWLQGRPVPSSPLLDYLTSNYTPVQQFNSVELLQRKGR